MQSIAPKKRGFPMPNWPLTWAFGAVLRSYRFDHYRTVREDERPTLQTGGYLDQRRLRCA